MAKRKTADELFAEARQKTLDAGLPVTELRGTDIVQVFPDGEVKVIGKTEAWVTLLSRADVEPDEP